VFNKKEREIFKLPYFPDRIVHHCIMQILEPIWKTTLIRDTYSSLKGRGVHDGLRRVKKAMKNPISTMYCLKFDVRKFYPSVDHDILKTIIEKKIKCKDTLWIIYKIIDSANGIPIGNYLSQYFANLYLAYFDHWIKEIKKIKYYFRYADDMVFLHSDKDFLHKLLLDIDKYLKEELKLTLKNNYQVFPISARGLDFVGFKFYHTYTLIRKKIKQNFCKRVILINKLNDISDKDYKQNICSWLGWTKYSNSRHLLKTIIKPKYYGSIL
jgi:retron-type reverse transcriptase